MNLFSPMFAQSAPSGMTDVLGLPMLCFLLGLGLWYGGLHFENRTEKSWMKWLAFIPIVIGLIIGFQLTMEAGDYAYQRILPNRKVLFAHYIALAMPIFAALTVGGWHLYLKKSGAYDRY